MGDVGALAVHSMTLEYGLVALSDLARLRTEFFEFGLSPLLATLLGDQTLSLQLRSEFLSFGKTGRTLLLLGSHSSSV